MSPVCCFSDGSPTYYSPHRQSLHCCWFVSGSGLTGIFSRPNSPVIIFIFCWLHSDPLNKGIYSGITKQKLTETWFVLPQHLLVTFQNNTHQDNCTYFLNFLTSPAVLRGVGLWLCSVGWLYSSVTLGLASGLALPGTSCLPFYGVGEAFVL